MNKWKCPKCDICSYKDPTITASYCAKCLTWKEKIQEIPTQTKPNIKFIDVSYRLDLDRLFDGELN